MDTSSPELSLTYTALEEIPKIRERARRAFLSGKTKSIAFRKEQIAQVAYLIKDNEQRFKDAFRHDLGRSDFETELGDFVGTYTELRDIYDNVESWARPYGAPFSFTFCMMQPELRHEPKGTVLIIAPYNFPLYLGLGPLIGAIGAGNAAVLKPSEQTPAAAALLAELIPRYLDHDLYHIINGGVSETTEALKLHWDHIFYTGNARVGRHIARAAADHLTPVTMELGGKNPVVLDPNFDVKLAAKRILWGRMLNAGQVCVCPEYVLLPEGFQDTFVDALKDCYHTFYPDGSAAPDLGFTHVISRSHAMRIEDVLRRSRGTVVLGGEVEVEQRYVAPTVVKNVKGDDSLMEEEIFGPVLAVVPVQDIDEAIAFINAREHPLVIYTFSDDESFRRRVFDNTRSGCCAANDCIIPPIVVGLPFGGVGASGCEHSQTVEMYDPDRPLMDGYNTGRHLFNELTHLRGSMISPSWLDTFGLSIRYPPYTNKSLSVLQRLLAPLPPRPGDKSSTSWSFWISMCATVGVAAAAAVLRSRWRRS